MALTLNAEELDEITESMVEKLTDSRFHHDLYWKAMVLVSDSHIRINSVASDIQKEIEKQGNIGKLRNEVYRMLAKSQKATDELPYLKKAQMNWEKRILKSLNTMCTELALPLAKKRTDKETKAIKLHWNELGAEEPDLSKYRPVYSPKDFLDVLASLKMPSDEPDADGLNCINGLISIPLRARTLKELQTAYEEFALPETQLDPEEKHDEVERMKLGQKVIKDNLSPLAMEYSKRGCPTSLRKQLWSQMLGVDVEDTDMLYYHQLKQAVLDHDLLIDSLIYKDIKLNAVNDDQYFVFEDFLYQALLIFARDVEVLEHFSRNTASPAQAYIKGKMGDANYSVVYPPNGVIPFHGFSMLVVPLGYVYDQPIPLYFVFREMYTRYLFRLHSISSHPEGILSLCVQFESLLQELEPDLVAKLNQLEMAPLRSAFPWMIRAFSGYLASGQVLLLWDRILAYESLTLVPVLAVAIFVFRKSNLMRASSAGAVEAILTDITNLEVVPLLQLVLFAAK